MAILSIWSIYSPTYLNVSTTDCGGAEVLKKTPHEIQVKYKHLKDDIKCVNKLYVYIYFAPLTNCKTTQYDHIILLY